MWTNLDFKETCYWATQTGYMWKEQTRGTWCFSVLPQRYAFLFGTLLGNDADSKGVSGVDVSLCCWDEDIFDQLKCFLLGQRHMLHTLHILETDLWKNTHTWVCMSCTQSWMEHWNIRIPDDTFHLQPTLCLREMCKKQPLTNQFIQVCRRLQVYSPVGASSHLSFSRQTFHFILGSDADGSTNTTLLHLCECAALTYVL